MEVLTYISCMDTAYVRESPAPKISPKISGNPETRTILGTWNEILGDKLAEISTAGQLKSIEAHLADSTLPTDLRPLYEAKKKKTGGFTRGWTKKKATLHSLKLT